MDNQLDRGLLNDKEVVLDNSGTMTATKNLDNISLPYVIKDKVLLSPGTWKGYIYTNQTITDAFNNTKWDFNNRSLFWEHDDKDGRAWVGEIRNIKLNNNAETIGDIYVVDRQLATNLDFGAKFGISPRLKGTARGDKVVWNAKFDNFSIVINPACTTTFLNSEIKDETEDVKNIGDVEIMTESVEQSSASTEINKLSSLIEGLSKEVSDIKSKADTLYSDREKIMKEEELKELEEKKKIAIAEKEVRDKRDIDMMETLKSINSKLGKEEPEAKPEEKAEAPATEKVEEEKAEEAKPAEADVAAEESGDKVDEKMSEDETKDEKKDEETEDKGEDEMTKEDNEPVSDSGRKAAEDLNIMLSIEKNKTFNNGYNKTDVEMVKYLKNAFKE